MRASATTVIHTHYKEKSLATGKRMVPCFFLKGRGSREFPKYQCVKRCHKLHIPWRAYMGSDKAKQDVGPELQARYRDEGIGC